MQAVLPQECELACSDLPHVSYLLIYTRTLSPKISLPKLECVSLVGKLIFCCWDRSMQTLH